MNKPTKIAIAVIVGALIVGLSVIIDSIYHPEAPDNEREVTLAGQTPEIVVDMPQNQAQATFEDLLDAIEYVESGGDPEAVGDGGNAVGSFQIHKIYVDDVNRIYRINHKDKYSSPLQYKSHHRRSAVCSRWMARAYLKHYATKERIGREPTFEDMARIHNAGPDGWRNDPQWFVRNRNYTLEKAEKKIANAKAYWEKVKRTLKEAEKL